MRFISRLTGAAVIVLVAGPSFAAQRGPRTLIYDPGMTIGEQLFPDDKVVRVAQPEDGDARPSITLQGLFENHSVTAVLVDVASVKGSLVESGSWIRTLFEGHVAEVISSGSGVSLSKGDAVKFSSDGGTVTIDRVLVETTGAAKFREGRYLVFLGNRSPDGDDRMVSTDPLMVRGAKLVAAPGSKTKLAGMSLEDVRQAARRIKQ